jgi:hypothetical protein
MLQSITEYKETVKADTGGQEPVGFERVPENVQVARAGLLQELIAAGIEVQKSKQTDIGLRGEWEFLYSSMTTWCVSIWAP